MVHKAESRASHLSRVPDGPQGTQRPAGQKHPRPREAESGGSSPHPPDSLRSLFNSLLHKVSEWRQAAETLSRKEPASALPALAAFLGGLGEAREKSSSELTPRVRPVTAGSVQWLLWPPLARGPASVSPSSRHMALVLWRGWGKERRGFWGASHRALGPETHPWLREGRSRGKQSQAAAAPGLPGPPQCCCCTTGNLESELQTMPTWPSARVCTGRVPCVCTTAPRFLGQSGF